MLSSPLCRSGLILVFAGLVSAVAPAHAAEAFAPVPSTLTLTVEMRFEAAGKRQDKLDLFEWRGRRTASFATVLAAGPPSPVSFFTGPDATQQAQMRQAGDMAQRAATTMAPMMAAAEQIAARCGDDEACMTREAQALGARLQGSPTVAAGRKAVGEAVQAADPGAPRFQLWQGQALLQGRYDVDEFMHVVHADPICMGLPRQRCTRDETRRGQGALAALPGNNQGLVLGPAMVEWDARQRSLGVRLPVLSQAPASDSVKTDEPAGTHSTAGLHWLKSPDLASDAVRQVLSFSLAAPTGPRGLAGERRVTVAGPDGAGGSLLVRWRLEAR